MATRFSTRTSMAVVASRTTVVAPIEISRRTGTPGPIPLAAKSNHCGGYTEGENDFGTAGDCGPHRMPGEFNGAMPGDPWNENPMGAAQKENEFGTNGFGQVREPGEDGNNGAFNSQFGFNNGFGSNGGS
ncbi:hypothetical protein PCANC_10799 [Puccinia coronata f. sp. avenae]|uniref:Uncharacterized protein n=1 Tax=Puccinia coronata f. sp. avenae TaxID=200324 RepID=A0A2N5V4C6_9BASI|nr:hypothetical protein PCANC_10799 [Puccinia coronata f. sp. avenae]